ncbi:hypothetical protein [Streptomyces sp. NPDC018031]|uniref:hypothetical protein n=1 Tax=Streptomyces sp. NPDC018031 TaxID=3365033 RepID=UPI00379F2880
MAVTQYEILGEDPNGNQDMFRITPVLRNAQRVDTDAAAEAIRALFAATDGMTNISVSRTTQTTEMLPAPPAE